ncbi:MAG: metal-independent alpha-mannosidase [Thermoanaerobacteraceae bacterium]|nr:metal-independent alpha-mannosidase [Thermoanaerobacteraceae bacterium]
MKIITRPEESFANETVYYAANHYIALPEIDTSGAIKSINATSIYNKGLIEIRGNNYLLKPTFYIKGKEVKPIEVSVELELYYIPVFKFIFDGFDVSAKIYCDIHEKGFVYELKSSIDLDVWFDLCPDEVNLLRFNTHRCYGIKEVFADKWLKNPCISLDGYNLSLAMAVGGDNDFHCEFEEKTMDIKASMSIGAFISLKTGVKNALYVCLNADADGASTTLIHFRRKGFERIYSELISSLNRLIIDHDNINIKKLINQNLLFNYFFSVSRDFYTDRLTAMTSRSKRYYVSGAFWERDSFLWSLRAIKLCDRGLHKKLYRELLLTHSRNAGDHAHYIDGSVLYPGFELDEAASYFIDLDFEDSFFDNDVLKAFGRIVERIEKEYDSEMGLYRTFLLPSDDPADHDFVLIDNVILLKGYQNLKELYTRLGRDTALLTERIETVKENLHKFIRNVDGKRIYAWSIDKDGSCRLYNDPPANLGTLVFYGMPMDDVFINTVEYYYSSRYQYYDGDARFKELACDHHPNTPSGLGLCGSLLNPIKRDEALDIVLNAPFDNGILSESFDKNTGEARTGMGFATGAGYLAFALYKSLVEVL